MFKCKGQLERADLPEEMRFPILMLKYHYVTLLLVRKAHEAADHIGMNTLVEVRRKYWIPQIQQ